MIEVHPLVRNLSILGVTGSEAMAHLKFDVEPTKEWRESALAKLDESAKPYAALEFAVVSGVRKLVLAAADSRQKMR